MHLFAALLPPREALDQVTELVSRVPVFESAPAEPAEPHRGTTGVLGRLLRRDPPAEAAPEPTGPQLDLVPITKVHLLIARFGSLTVSDAERLTDTLRAQATGWPAPRLRLHGGDALPWPGDQSVWLSLAGDLDELGAVARGVTRAAQGLQLFVDRRAFRPMIELGTITDWTTAPWLEQLVAALEEFDSEPWLQSTVTLLVPSEAAHQDAPYRVYAEIPLGEPVSS